MMSSTSKEELKDILNRIEEINKKYDNEDIVYEISEIRNDLEKPNQNLRFIKRAFNAMKGVAIGIMANELTPLIDKGIELLSNLF